MMRDEKDDPLLRYCEWAGRRVGEGALVALLCAALLTALFS